MRRPPTADQQAATTPLGALAVLREGNRRFADGTPTARDDLADVAATTGGQHPLAAVLSCIDSRVPAEKVLDVGIGSIFSLRTAGNVVDTDVLGGLEFATAVAGVPAVVVLGHSACGAVKGACDGVELGNLTSLLSKIQPAVAAVTGSDDPPGSEDTAVVDAVIEQNVRNAVAAITASDVLAARVADGDLTVVGAVYDLATARITWLA